MSKPHRCALVVRVSASSAACHGFAPRPSHTKNHNKNGTNCLHAWHTGVRVGVWQCSLNVFKGLVVCGTVYGGMHYKDLLGSIARVEYCTVVPGFNLVLHGPLR